MIAHNMSFLERIEAREANNCMFDGEIAERCPEPERLGEKDPLRCPILNQFFWSRDCRPETSNVFNKNDQR
jgi:hypothetical protein